jgi:hypothetical protein
MSIPTQIPICRDSRNNAHAVGLNRDNRIATRGEKQLPEKGGRGLQERPTLGAGIIATRRSPFRVSRYLSRFSHEPRPQPGRNEAKSMKPNGLAVTGRDPLEAWPRDHALDSRARGQVLRPPSLGGRYDGHRPYGVSGPRMEPGANQLNGKTRT